MTTKKDSQTEVQEVAFESNLAKADRLHAEKADDATVLKEYKASYKEKGKTNDKWIKERAKIYMKIAAKKAEAAKEAKKKAKPVTK